MTTVDLFAGMGGASDGLAAAGLEPIGVEWDAIACSSHHAAGHATIRADLTYPLPVAGPVGFLWASPPCTAFSTAGKQTGLEAMPRLLAAVHRRDWDAGPWIADDPNVWLPLVAMRAVAELAPDRFAFEQVPAVLPLWEAFARQAGADGYSCWSGVLNAADYGVPQTRRRAFLIGSRVGIAYPPLPTHAAAPVPSLFDTPAPWVTMADALGWSDVSVHQRRGAGMVERYGERPPGLSTSLAPAITTGVHRRLLLDRRQQQGPPGERSAVRLVECDTEPAPTVTVTALAAGQWVFRRPATTVVGSFRPDVIAGPGYRTETSRQNAEGSVHVTLAEAMVLQGFPPDRVVLGSRSAQFRQVGNAVPPPVAAAVARALWTRA